LPLDAFRFDIVEDGQIGMSIAGHVQQLHASDCYTKSDSLTCTTCHDPHHRNSVAERPVEMRNICLSCHADRGCRVPEEQRLREADNRCAKCHMPDAPPDWDSRRDEVAKFRRIGRATGSVPRDPASQCGR
jgi:predicted CXXCH cytochrome family protein